MSRPRAERLDLMARVDAEVRDRIVEAVDFTCVDLMVQARRRHNLPAPAPESVEDRAEFDASVEAFLTRLGDELSSGLDPEQRRSLEAAAERAGASRLTRQLAYQLALAKLLPDYWQRFERTREAFTAEAATAAPWTSGRDRPGWLGRIFRG